MDGWGVFLREVLALLGTGLGVLVDAVGFTFGMV